MKSRDIHLIDTTLRDGAQAAGVVLSADDRFCIAQHLAAIDITEIEAGIPAMGDAEKEFLRGLTQKLSHCTIRAWCRALPADLDHASQSGVRHVHIAFPFSEDHLRALHLPDHWPLQSLMELLPLACDSFSSVTVGVVDASRAGTDRLQKFVEAALALGARRVRIADTVGALTPLATAALTRELNRSASPDQLEFHGHDDLGMAVGNTMAAIETGMGNASVTVLGLGERAGNAALEEVVMALRVTRVARSRVVTQGLREICDLVARLSRIPIPVGKAVVGSRAFIHESGIHTHALARSSSTYEPFPPEEAGHSASSFVAGTHSGSTGIMEMLRRHRISITRDCARELAEQVRDISARRKSVVTEEELLGLYRHLLSGKNPEARECHIQR
ncbi:MAG: hypothetical protein MUF22_07980 [Chitinispirillaceae bacterium]|jgi:homocitrate synthase NifV|nr:hypothetical protein [Chitinispirillaceae bacterium]